RANAEAAQIATANDFNGDGRSDLLYARQNGSGFTVMVAVTRADGGDAFTPLSVFDSGPGDPLNAILLRNGDFNGDGRSDLALVRAIGPGHVELSVLISDGNQMLALPALWESSGGWDLTAIQVSVADFTGDGLDDLVVAHPE